MEFKIKNNEKLFEHQASEYLKYRPTYPAALFEFIIQSCTENKVAWDCACGSGQASVQLAKYFDHVYATDAQKNQLENAVAADNVTYQLASAESSTLQSDSVDCITVAQALHWFANNDFFREAKRVGKPGAIVAAWCYPLLTVDDVVNIKLRDFYLNVTKPYWAKGREYIDDRYSNIPFDFDEKKVNSFWSDISWNLQDLLGYVSTWSAVQRYKEIKDHDPVKEILQPDLQEVCRKVDELKVMKFEFICLSGRI